MKQKKVIIKIIFLALIIALNSCDKSTNPQTRKSVRDYTWTIDTLNLPDPFQNKMRSMYAANADDIYLVGHNSTGDPNGCMWHYNGSEWSTVKLREKLGGFQLNSIHGSSSNNVWAVGSKQSHGDDFKKSFIAQYDGAEWKEHLAKTPNGMFDAPISKHEIYSVFAESETEVWACGAGGLVYHYDGNSWAIDTLKMSLKEDEKLLATDIVIYNSEILLLGRKYNSGEAWGTYYFLKKQDDKWEIIDSLVQNVIGGNTYKWGIGNFHKSVSNKLYSCGSGGVFEYSRNNWSNIFNSETSITNIDVKKNNEMIIVGTFGLIYHYDGIDWKKITAINNNDISYTGITAYEDEAFIIGYHYYGFPQQTIVLHGK
ncbi:MAG: hypothetical protein PF445_05260 [Melioribacteraceae bacterium]|jgi:hypothetical protein|nr:hypothetical protein [Melioribacteraceae bacterium]